MRIRIGRTYVSRCGDVFKVVRKNDTDPVGFRAKIVRVGHATECCCCVTCEGEDECWLGPDGEYSNWDDPDQHDVVGQINKAVSKRAISQMELEAAMHFMAWCKENGIKIR